MPVLPLKNPPNADGTFVISEEDRRHSVLVRRLKSGSLIEVLLPDGKRAQAEVTEAKGQWCGKILKIIEGPLASILPCRLGVGMVRWPRMEWLAEKSAELGLAHLIPLYCKRSKYPPEDALSPHKLERLAKIARETQKQCEVPTASTIHPPQSLFSWLDEMKILPGRKIFLDEEATEPPLTPDLLRPAAPEYIFLVGPEGGWAPEERKKILQSGFQSVSLGLKLLKTETAALYAMILLDATLGK